ncbi:MAG: TIR domain-containing protein [Gammaproteobacteria bacterium]|nr:TIR domain-containing protein [Gammaproteobacteria bacterium]
MGKVSQTRALYACEKCVYLCRSAAAPPSNRRSRMSDVFISYAREDAESARRFAEAFAAEGLSTWWDDALRSGEAFDESIERALREAAAVVVLWSASSVASRWVRAEATLADRNRTLVPVTIEPCQRPIIFELTQTADLAHWRGDRQDRVWRGLVADVRRLVESQAAPRGSPGGAAAPSAKQVADQPSKPGVVILPFVNMSGDPEQEFFSDGVTEDIITDLGRVSALSVASRSSAFSYKGKTVAPAQIARALSVTHVLEGSVRKSGNRVRITAQLLEAHTDKQVWAERYDRTLDDIFAIQDDISKAIVGALKLKLLPEEKAAIEQRSTSNSDAYELFLMAREFQRKGSERLKPVIVRICQRVVQLDPGFARGWALMSLAEAEMSQRGVDGHSIANARDWAERAIAADPNVAEGHAAFAEAVLRNTLDHDATNKVIETALQADPNCYEAHTVAGAVAIGQRDYERAIRHFERAIELDPAAYWPAGMVVQAYEALGEPAATLAAERRAMARCEKILAEEPDHSGALGFLVTSLAGLGQAERARAWTQRALLFDPDNARLHYNLACAMSRLGDAEAAVELIEPWIDQVSHGWLLWMRSDNSLDPIRNHPRFVAMMDRCARRLDAETGSQYASAPQGTVQ